MSARFSLLGGAGAWLLGSLFENDSRQRDSFEIWVDPAGGDDRASGDRDHPVRTHAEVHRRVLARGIANGPVEVTLNLAAEDVEEVGCG